jgi:hypothetical protein
MLRAGSVGPTAEALWFNRRECHLRCTVTLARSCCYPVLDDKSTVGVCCTAYSLLRLVMVVA